MDMMALSYAITYGIICGFGVNKIIHDKGYKENWFLWGFFFGIFAIIVASAKPENTAYSNDDSIIEEKGGWKCSKCGTVNLKHTTMCKCGNLKINNKKDQCVK